MFCLLFFLVGQVFCVADEIGGWNSINLHCRDNSNKPVDWWVIYKPPSGGGPYWESGRNFTYITSKQRGKWELSNKLISTSSMLQLTLSPMMRPSYSDHIALLSYHSKKSNDSNPGSSALGILLADDIRGLWIMYTVPKLADLIQNRHWFPEEEIGNGHMVMCLAADLDTINEIAKSLRVVQPDILKLRIPLSVRPFLPDWKNVAVPILTPVLNPFLKQTQFRTNGTTLKAVILARLPGDHRCLYKTFAKKMKIILDVYGHDARMKTYCTKEYSVRNVNSISLKYPDNIYYINNNTDRFGFAVSTAAHWQRKGGASGSQYWVCIGSMEKEDVSGNGGLVVCLEDYLIWRSFDILKIKEPEC